jgi:predicted dithiol-disulfide oxidoreductase (DUF899 family)
MQNRVVRRDEWLEARAELVEKEKEHTRNRDALAETRRRMPWARVQKEHSLVGYSAFNRSIEELNGAFGYFDLLRKGRAC